MSSKRDRQILERLDELKEQIEAQSDKKGGAKSLPPGRTQRTIERVTLSPTAWATTKDVVRAFVPTSVEAIARAKVRGEDFTDAKAKAEEAREGIEERRPGLYTTGAAVQGIASTAAGIYAYTKFAPRESAATPPAKAPIATPRALTATKAIPRASGRVGAALAIATVVARAVGKSKAAAPTAPPALGRRSMPYIDRIGRAYTNGRLIVPRNRT